MKTIPIRRTPILFEPLETRIAPATLVGNVLHYSDVDGDNVSVTITTKGGASISPSNFTFNNSFGATTEQQLEEISFFLNAGFNGANITVTAKRNSLGAGDGFANIGYIDAAAVDLGTVNIKGDLGAIDAGDANTKTNGLKSLTVQSLGRMGTSTGAPDLESDILGPLGSLTVKGDVVGAFVNVSGFAAMDAANGKIGAVKIGGSLIGGPTKFSGAILGSSGFASSAKIGGDVRGGTGDGSAVIVAETVAIGGSVIAEVDGGIVEGAIVTINGSVIGGGDNQSGVVAGFAVKIGGDVQGGVGDSSGSIIVLSTATIARSITVGGSLIGGLGADSGAIEQNTSGNLMGPIKIGGSVRGGGNDNTGFIESAGTIASVTIGGSLIGSEATDAGGSANFGTIANTGTILSTNDMGPVKIAGNIVAGGTNLSFLSSASLDGSGFIGSSLGRIASVSVGGSIYAGTRTDIGTLTHDGSIAAQNDIGSLVVKGSLVGSVASPVFPPGITFVQPVIISARGQATQSATTDVAIGSIAIGGRVENADIFAGYDFNLVPVNGDAQIGAVKVAGDWIASNLVAGVENPGSGNTNFGVIPGVVSISAGSASIVAKIASIAIGGQVLGTVGGTDGFGFVSQQIGSLSVGGTRFGTHSGPDNDFDVLGATNDVLFHEI
jgi:hypothetical protein